ncbi:hypothetical protein [Streptomyces sp. NPDC059928]|uniref:hypothetical protein n=1 Tax=unclassified Streptomyces TaxID=2593676 RepID=UPI003662B95A
MTRIKRLILAGTFISAALLGASPAQAATADAQPMGTTNASGCTPTGGPGAFSDICIGVDGWSSYVSHVRAQFESTSWVGAPVTLSSTQFKIQGVRGGQHWEETGTSLSGIGAVWFDFNPGVTLDVGSNLCASALINGQYNDWACVRLG